MSSSNSSIFESAKNPFQRQRIRIDTSRIFCSIRHSKNSDNLYTGSGKSSNNSTSTSSRTSSSSILPVMMTTPEDIDAFFDALVDGVGFHDEETDKRGDQQQQQTRIGPDTTGAQAAPAEAAAVTEHAAAVGDTSPRLSAASKAARAASAAEVAPTAAATGTAQQPVSRPPNRPQQPQQPSQQQQLQGAAFLREPPELRPEPPYRYEPYLNTEEGRQQQAADAQMETANLCASVFAVSRLIESKLKENEHMLFAVHENMTVRA